jgi:hypothetical protein
VSHVLVPSTDVVERIEEPGSEVRGPMWSLLVGASA